MISWTAIWDPPIRHAQSEKFGLKFSSLSIAILNFPHSKLSFYTLSKLSSFTTVSPLRSFYRNRTFTEIGSWCFWNLNFEIKVGGPHACSGAVAPYLYAVIPWFSNDFVHDCSPNSRFRRWCHFSTLGIGLCLLSRKKVIVQFKTREKKIGHHTRLLEIDILLLCQAPEKENPPYFNVRESWSRVKFWRVTMRNAKLQLLFSKQ